MRRTVLDDVTVEVTNRCDLRCRACAIWTERERHEISPAQFAGILRRLTKFFRLGFVSITGGEPFLHSDIFDLISYLAKYKRANLVKGFGIYTNGVHTQKIIEVFKRGLTLSDRVIVGISIDGTEDVHNYRRGANAFKRSMATVKALAEDYTAMAQVELKFTAGKDNYEELYAVYQMALKYGVRFSPKLEESGVSAYYHRNGRKGAKKGEKPDTKMAESLRRQVLMILKNEGTVHKGTVDPGMLRMFLSLVARGGDAIRSCRTPEKCLFITSRGDVYPCLYMEPGGSILSEGFSEDDFMARRAELISCGREARCPRCFAYHGVLKSCNLRYVK